MPNGQQEEKKKTQEDRLLERLKEFGLRESDIVPGSDVFDARREREAGNFARAKRLEDEIVAEALWAKKTFSRTLESARTGKELPRQGVLTMRTVENLLDRLVSILPGLVEFTAEDLGQGEFWGTGASGPEFQGVPQSTPLQDLFETIKRLATPQNIPIETWKNQKPGFRYIRDVEEGLVGEYFALLRGISEEAAKIMGPTVQPEVLQIDDAVTDLMVYWSAVELYDVDELARATTEYLGYILGRADALMKRMEDSLAENLQKLGVTVNANTTLPEINNIYILELSEAQLFNLGLIPGTLDFVAKREISEAESGLLPSEFARLPNIVPVFRDSRNNIIKFGATFTLTGEAREEVIRRGLNPNDTKAVFEFIRNQNVQENVEPETFIEANNRRSLLTARDEIVSELETMAIMSAGITPIASGPIKNLAQALEQAVARQLRSGLGSTARNTVARGIFSSLDDALTPFFRAEIKAGRLTLADRQQMYRTMKALQAEARLASTTDDYVNLVRKVGEAYLQGQLSRRHIAVISNHIGGTLTRAFSQGRRSISGAMSRIFAELEIDPAKLRATMLSVVKPVGPTPNLIRPLIARQGAGFKESSRASRANLARLVQEVQKLEIEIFGTQRLFNPTVSASYRDVSARVVRLEQELFKNPTKEGWEKMQVLVRTLNGESKLTVANAIKPFRGKVDAAFLTRLETQLTSALETNTKQMLTFSDEIVATIGKATPKPLSTVQSVAVAEAAATTEKRVINLWTEEQFAQRMQQIRNRMKSPPRGKSTTTGTGNNATNEMGKVLTESIPAGPAGTRLFVMESAVNRMANRADRVIKELDGVLGVGRFPTQAERALEKEFDELGSLLGRLTANPADATAFEAMAAKIRALPQKIVRFEAEAAKLAPQLRTTLTKDAAAFRADTATIERTIQNSVETALARHQPGVQNAQDMQKLLEAIRRQNEIVESNLRIGRIQQQIAQGNIPAGQGGQLVAFEKKGLIQKLRAAGGWRRVAGEVLNGPAVLYRGLRRSTPLLIAAFAVQQTWEFLVWGPAIYGEISGNDVLGYGGVGTKRVRTFVNGLITVDQSVRQAINARAWEIALINLRNYEIQVNFLDVLITQNQAALRSTNHLAESVAMVLNHRRAIQGYEARIETGLLGTATKEKGRDEQAARPASTAQLNYITALVNSNRVELTAAEQKKVEDGTLNVKEASEIIDRKTEPYKDNSRGVDSPAPKWGVPETPLEQTVQSFKNRNQPVGGTPASMPPQKGLTGIRTVT